jgi:hypothetical protein
MRYLWLVFFPFLLCCRLDDCGVLIHSAQTYQGTGTEPYLEQVDFYTRPQSCSLDQCVYDTITVIALHNPTAQSVQAQYRCSFRADGQEITHAKPSPLLVPAHSTRKVEVGGMINVLNGENLSVECKATFK